MKPTICGEAVGGSTIKVMVRLPVLRACTPLTDVLATLDLTKESRQISALVVKYNRSRHVVVKVGSVKNALDQNKASLADIEGVPAAIISRSRAARRRLPPHFEPEEKVLEFVKSRPVRQGLIFIDRCAAILIS